MPEQTIQPLRLSEAKARAARTVVQMTPSAVIVEIIDSTIWNMDERQYAAIFAGLTLVIAYLQVKGEDWSGYALFRKFSRNDPAVISTPSTPLNDPTQNKLPSPVQEAQPEQA